MPNRYRYRYRDSYIYIYVYAYVYEYRRYIACMPRLVQYCCRSPFAVRCLLAFGTNCSKNVFYNLPGNCAAAWALELRMGYIGFCAISVCVCECCHWSQRRDTPWYQGVAYKHIRHFVAWLIEKKLISCSALPFVAWQILISLNLLFFLLVNGHLAVSKTEMKRFNFLLLYFFGISICCFVDLLLYTLAHMLDSLELLLPLQRLLLPPLLGISFGRHKRECILWPRLGT